MTNNKELIEKLKCEYAYELSNKYFLSMESIGFDRKEALMYLKKIRGDK